MDYCLLQISYWRVRKCLAIIKVKAFRCFRACLMTWSQNRNHLSSFKKTVFVSLKSVNDYPKYYWNDSLMIRMTLGLHWYCEIDVKPSLEGGVDLRVYADFSFASSSDRWQWLYGSNYLVEYRKCNYLLDFLTQGLLCREFSLLLDHSFYSIISIITPIWTLRISSWLNNYLRLLLASFHASLLQLLKGCDLNEERFGMIILHSSIMVR